MNNYKRNRTYKEKLLDALDKLNNIEPNLYNSIYNKMLVIDITFTDVQKIKKYILYNFLNGGVEHGRNTADYWLVRGWPPYYAKKKAKEFNKKTQEKRISPFSYKHWLNKINENTNKLYTEKEARFKCKSQNPVNKEYWINLGYAENDAINNSNLHTKDISKKGIISNNSNSIEEKRKTSVKCVDYWIELGYDINEAKKIISESQHTFSLNKCIEKFGIDQGTVIWQKRQTKWQATLNDKTEEERNEISRKKICKHGIISAAELDIIKQLNEKFVDISAQFGIKGYVCDIVRNKKVVEYYGDYWHCNPQVYKEDYFNKKQNKTAKDIWEKDNRRLEVIRDAGFEVLVIWEREYKKNKDETITKLIQYFTN